MDSMATLECASRKIAWTTPLRQALTSMTSVRLSQVFMKASH